MAEILEQLQKRLYYGRSSLRWQLEHELGDDLPPAEELLERLRANPEHWPEHRTETGERQASLAVLLAKKEYGILSNEWWYYYFRELPEVRREMFHWQRPDRQEVYYYPYLELEKREPTPEETGAMPAADAYVLWHGEMSESLNKAMVVWDAGERLRTCLLLADNHDDEPGRPAETDEARERVLKRLRARLQPMFDKEYAQLMQELLDPAAALEAYDKAYAQFRHLFQTYGSGFGIRGLWEQTDSRGDAHLNTQMFFRASLRLSETKMRLRRHADSDPTVLERAIRLREAVDESWRRDEEIFFGQLF